MATEESIKLWLKVGNLRKLEQAVLDGYGDQLRGRNSRIPKINKFLKRVPHFQAKIAGIHEAASKGNLRDLESLLDRKPLVLGRNRHGASPLHTAVVNKQVNIVKYLTEKYPACLHAKDHQGRTALHYAAVVDDAGEIHDILLAAGADSDLADLSGKIAKDYQEKPEELPLQKLLESTSEADAVATYSQSAREISSALIRQPSPMAPLTRSELRALIQRGEIGKLEKALALGHGEKLLGETAVNTRIKDLIESVPDYLTRVNSIHEAATNGSLRTLKSLLNRKFLVVARDSQGMTALHKATIANQPDIVNYLLQVYPKVVHAKDHDKRTALHYAAILPQNDSNIYDILIKGGSSSILPDVDGRTAEFYRQHPDSLVIKKSDAKTTATNKGSSTSQVNPEEATSKQSKRESSPGQPSKSGSLIKQWLQSGDLEKLEKAVIEGHGMRLLKEQTGDPRARAFLRSVPAYMAKMVLIHETVCRGELRNLRLLLDRRKLALARDQLGLSLLHKAVLFDQPEIVRFLLDEYPEVLNMKDKTGRTALHYAATMKTKDDLFQMLLDAGADANQQDLKGHDAEYYKANEADLGIGELLNRINRQRSRKRPSRAQAAKPQADNGFLITGGNIRKWIHAEDLRRLEQVVLEGQGYKLLLETSNNPKVKQFLNGVPGLVNKIREVHSAAAMGELSALENLIMEKPVLLSSKDELGMTPLHKAVISDQLPVVEYIIGQKPSSIGTRDESGRTALHYAAGIKDGGQIYHALLGVGIDASLQDNKGKVAEHYTHHPGELDIRQMQAHIQRTKPLQNNNGNNHKNDQPNMSAKPPTHPMLRPVRKPPSSGLSSEVINRIIQSGDLDKLEQLVLDGYGKRLVGKTSWNEDVRAFLRKVPHYMDKIYAVHTASATGDILLLHQLLDKKKMVVSKDEYGLTPLHKAIKYGQMDVIQFLLQTYPAGHTAKDQDGRTPLHYASMYKDREDLYQLLLNRGADPQAKDQRGKSPESYLACHSKLEIPAPPRPIEKMSNGEEADATSQENNTTCDSNIENWISEGNMEELDRLIIDGHGEKLLGKSTNDPKVQEFLECVPAYMGKIRAIHNASASGELKDLQLLLDNDRLAQSRDEHGATPWHRSILQRHKDVIRFLAHNYPSTINCQDKTGLTPLHYAALVNDEGHFYKLLLNIGANPNIKDMNGNSPGQYLRGKPTVTLEELLRRYEERKVPPRPPSVQMWERPPTEELLRALTPSPLSDDIPRMPSSNQRHFEELTAKDDAEGDISPDGKNEEEAAEADDEESIDSDKCNASHEQEAAAVVESDDKEHILLETLEEEDDVPDMLDDKNPLKDDVGMKIVDEYEKTPRISEVEEIDVDDEISASNKEETASDSQEENDTDNIQEENAPNNDTREESDSNDDVKNDELISGVQETDETYNLIHEDEIKDKNPGESTSELKEVNDESQLCNDDAEIHDDITNVNESSRYVTVSSPIDDNENRDQSSDILDAEGKPYDGESDRNMPLLPFQSNSANQSDDSPSESSAKDQAVPVSSHSLGTENPMSWTKEGDYLAAVLGDALIRSLTDVSVTRPANPTSQLALNLYQHANEQEQGLPGSSILHFAAAKSHEEGAFWQLIAHSGCSLADRDSRLRTPTQIAIESGHVENAIVIDAYIKDLASNGNIDALEMLLLDGYQSFNITSDEASTMTPEVLQFLANVDKFQDQRESLHKAIHNDDVAEVINKTDARLAKAKNIKSQCSLHLAIMKENGKIVQYLATHFPEVTNIRDNMGRTPLHYAMATNHIEKFIEILLENGADRLIKDDLKHTPCYYAIRRSEIQHLIEEVDQTSI